MDFRIITDLVEAKNAWNTLSPHKTIDDEWDFRYAFVKPLNYELHFIAGYEGEKLVGLLPLQKNTGEGLMPPYAKKENAPFLEFFGGDDTDDNTLLTDGVTPLAIESFLSQLTLPAFLAPLSPVYASTPDVTHYETKYSLSVENYTNHEDFLRDKWNSSSRKKMLQQTRNIGREHTIEILENNYEDIDLLSDFNIQRFGNQSSFSHDYRKQIFKDLAQLYSVVMLTIVVDGKKEAVSYGIHYKDAYVGMNAGVNSQIPDLPKLLIMLQIDKTIALGCKIYDAGKGDSGWKEAYKLDQIPQYLLTASPKS